MVTDAEIQSQVSLCIDSKLPWSNLEQTHTFIKYNVETAYIEAESRLIFFKMQSFNSPFQRIKTVIIILEMETLELKIQYPLKLVLIHK